MALDGKDQAAKALFTRDADAEQMGFEDYEDALCDALTNLMHFAERYNIDFSAALGRADRHFSVESTYDWERNPVSTRKEPPHERGRAARVAARGRSSRS